MTKILEFRKPKITVNPALNRQEGVVFFPEKLAAARATLEKYGVPEGWEEDILEQEETQAFWQTGVLTYADRVINTFAIVAEATATQPQKVYKITASTEELTQIVKKYWGSALEVRIKPQGDLETATMFDLIDVI